jgi:hypothetical protein
MRIAETCGTHRGWNGRTVRELAVGQPGVARTPVGFLELNGQKRLSNLSGGDVIAARERRWIIEGFPSPGELLILNGAMLRVATALIVLFSLASAPLVSAVCRDCCNRSVVQPIPLCHDKAHAHLGPHVHHMNHVHMVSDDSDAKITIEQCDHQFRDSRLSCHAAACLSARPVQASVVSAASHEQKIPLHLVASGICSSLPVGTPRRPRDAFRTRISSSPSASVPLRI